MTAPYMLHQVYHYFSDLRNIFVMYYEVVIMSGAMPHMRKPPRWLLPLREESKLAL
tara:strand:- start:253412 stop:253579 length:168 start_codon:yes stop_codon:yes gene_type:complete